MLPESDSEDSDEYSRRMRHPPRTAPKSTPMPAAREMTGEIGTFRYMAPEIYWRLPYTLVGDCYSFAMVVWYMLHGIPPFHDRPVDDLAAIHHTAERPHIDNRFIDRFGMLLDRGWDPSPER